MDQKLFIKLIVAISLISIMVATYMFEDVISPTKGSLYEYLKLFRASIIALISIVATRIIITGLIEPIEIKREVKFPNIIKDTIGFFMICIASIIIVTQIYGQSPSIIISFLAGSGIAMTYAGVEFLKEIIAGIVIDMRNDFRSGDWIKFQNGNTAKVIKNKLTGVELELPDGALLYVANTAITNQPIVNLKQTEEEIYANISVVSEKDSNVNAVQNALYYATIKANGICNKTVLVVTEKVQQNGILFGVYFKIADNESFLAVQSQVIGSIITALQKRKIRICEISSQYPLQNICRKVVRAKEMQAWIAGKSK